MPHPNSCEGFTGMFLVSWLIAYLIIIGLVIVRTRRMGIHAIHILVFAVNFGACFWLLLMFRFLTMSENPACAAGMQSHSWLSWGCLLLAILLLVVTIIGLADAGRPGLQKMTSEERKAAMEEVRRKRPAVTAALMLFVFWAVFIGEGTFKYFRDNIWQIAAGVVASSVIAWIIVVLMKGWLGRGAP